MPKPPKPDTFIPTQPVRPARVTRPSSTPIPTERPSGFDAFAVAAPGLAPLVAAECVAHGVTPRDVSPAGVSFNATAEQLFTVNLWSRLASRVLVRLAEFEARDFATLEKMAARPTPPPGAWFQLPNQEKNSDPTQSGMTGEVKSGQPLDIDVK